MRIRDEQLINRFHEFMDDHEIKSIEDVYQQDKISKECVELVAELSVSCWENRIGGKYLCYI